MDCLFQVGRISGGFVEERESHCIMRVRNGKAKTLMKQSSSGRKECLKKNHRSDHRRSNKAASIIE